MANLQEFSMKSLTCEKVVVYTDRAEVKRTLKLKLNEGENEIVFSNVANFIDQESVRYVNSRPYNWSCDIDMSWGSNFCSISFSNLASRVVAVHAYSMSFVKINESNQSISIQQKRLPNSNSK